MKRFLAVLMSMLVLLSSVSFVSAQTKSQLVLEVNVPSYTNKRHIDVVGRTEQNAVVELWLNGKLVRKTTFTDGDIEFNDVALEPNKENVLVVKAFAQGLSAEKTFKVVCDLMNPVLRLKELPLITDKQKTKISGNISEQCNVEIFLNNNSVFSAQNVLSFSKEVVLNEGVNSIRIVAADKAGNKAEVSHSVVRDTKPPAIEELHPKSGAFYYEGRTVDDVKGKTEPYSEVKLYVLIKKDGEEQRELIDKTKADKDGWFVFEDVNFAQPKIGVSLWQIEPGEEVQTELLQQSRTVKFLIEVTDLAGHKVEKELVISIGTCWSGSFDFDIDILPEYKFPTLLSPERLAEGTERISFIMNVSYVGGKKKGEWRIVDVKIDHACGRSLSQLAEYYKNDPRYEIACSLLKRRPHPHKDSNRDKTLWYVEYKNLYSDEFDELVRLHWNELRRKLKTNELIFPLRITIAYREKEKRVVDGKVREVFGETKYQTKCVSVGYFVDFPVDPRDVFPDWLLKDGISFANKTIQKIDKIMPTVDSAVLSVGTGCIAAMLGRIAVKIIRKISCAWESLTGKFKAGQQQGSEGSSCPSAEKRLKLSTTDLKQKCPNCAYWWNVEAKEYGLYRLLCDRIFCHRTPAGWTAGEDFATIRSAEAAQKFCGLDEKVGLTPLRKFRWDAVQKEVKDLEEDPSGTRGVTEVYFYKNAYYGNPEQRNNYYVLQKIAYRKKAGVVGPKKLTVIKEGDTFATAIDKNCSALCKDFFGKDFVGRCLDDEESCAKQGEDHYPVGYSKDCFPEKVCCCGKTSRKKEEKRENICSGEWDYRTQQIYRETNGKYQCKYPENKYFSGRDIYACFGMDHLLQYLGAYQGNQRPVILDPRDHIVAFQCACLTGIRGRLVMLRNIMSGFMNCLEQVKKTGKANAGVCKEFFAMYFCDLIYQLFVALKKGCITLPFGGNIRIGKIGEIDVGGSTTFDEVRAALSIGINSVYDTVTEFGKDLEAEYGETVFSNFLAGGSREISRKICLAALGFDVGFDMRALLDVGYTSQFKTTAEVFSARRDFLTYNPATGIPTYEYRASWLIFPGCDIESYTVDLVCVNMEERSKYKGIDCSAVGDKQHGEATKGCNCLYSTEPYSARSRRFFVSPGPIKAGSFVDQSHHAVIEDSKRYDHIRIKINLKPGFSADKCFPPGHKDGVFYFPIVDKTARDLLDCFVDQKGIMKCTRGIEWEQKGDAYFVPFSKEECKSGKECFFLCRKGNEWKDCDKVSYTTAEPINVRVRVAQKRDQCLYYEFTTHTGKKKSSKFAKLMSQMSVNDYVNNDYVLNLGVASAADFAQGIEYSQSLKCVNLSLSRVESFDGKYQERFATLVVENKNGNYTISLKKGGEILFKGNMTNRKSFTETEISDVAIRVGGFAYKFSLKPNARKGNCTIEVKKVKKEYPYNLRVELRYLDSDMQCDADAKETIYSTLGLSELQQKITIVR